MSDTMTPEQRSRCMAAIHGKDTKPEVLVRKFLFAKGLRFRVCDRKLPGTPDIVLPKYKTVIFIDGCFWHGHEGCKYYQIPKTNTEFWKVKVRINKARDMRNDAALVEMGWKIIHIWECEIRSKTNRETILENLHHRIAGNMPAPQPYTHPVSDLPLAAESEPIYDSRHLSVIKSHSILEDGTLFSIVEYTES